MNIDIFYSELEREIQFLKDNLTDEEKGRLDFDALVPEDPSFCVYGQATGECFSKRAGELIVSLDPIVMYEGVGSYGFVDVVNAKQFRAAKLRLIDQYISFTALELFIVNSRDGDNEKIIQFIKGELNEMPELLLSATN